MKVFREIDLQNFEPWSGAKQTFEALTTEDLETLQSMLEELYPDGIDETTLNDILWFEDDWIADVCGYESKEEMYKNRESNENEEG